MMCQLNIIKALFIVITDEPPWMERSGPGKLQLVFYKQLCPLNYNPLENK